MFFVHGFVFSFQGCACGSCSLLKVDGWFAWFLGSNGWDVLLCFGLANSNNWGLSSYLGAISTDLFLCCGWLKMIPWGHFFLPTKQDFFYIQQKEKRNKIFNMILSNDCMTIGWIAPHMANGIQISRPN